jgi:hypothetical protein
VPPKAPARRAAPSVLGERIGRASRLLQPDSPGITPQTGEARSVRSSTISSQNSVLAAELGRRERACSLATFTETAVAAVARARRSSLVTR